MNNEKFGGGVRLRYEQRPQMKRRPDLYYKIDLYAEYLHLYQSIDPQKRFFYDNIARDDIRLGLNTWTTIENIKPIFCEIYGDLSYHSSNFSAKGEDDYYVLILAPKIGLSTTIEGIGSESKEGMRLMVRPGLYGTFEYVRDFGGREWNRNPFSNNTKYGMGVRALISESPSVTRTPLEFGITLYAEHLWVDYHSRAVKWEVSDKDFRIGVQMWLPLGQAKYGR